MFLHVAITSSLDFSTSSLNSPASSMILSNSSSAARDLTLHCALSQPVNLVLKLVTAAS